MRFEIVERLKGSLYATVEEMVHWEFTTGDGFQMVADRSSFVESTWTGVRSEDYCGQCLCTRFIDQSLVRDAVASNEHDQDDLKSSKTIKEKVEELVKEMMDSKESENYVVVSLIWRPGHVNQGQRTSA